MLDRYQSKFPKPTTSDLCSIAPNVARKWKPQEAVPPRFRNVCDFRNYRLRNTDPSHQAKKVGKARKHLNTTRSAISSFDGTDPGTNLELLDIYTTACEQNEVAEGIAVVLMAYYLKG